MKGKGWEHLGALGVKGEGWEGLGFARDGKERAGCGELGMLRCQDEQLAAQSIDVDLVYGSRGS